MSPSAACYQVDNAPNLNDRLCPYDNPGVDLLVGAYNLRRDVYNCPN